MPTRNIGITTEAPLLRAIIECRTPLGGVGDNALIDLRNRLMDSINPRWLPTQDQESEFVRKQKSVMLNLVQAIDRDEFVRDTYLLTIKDFATATWGFINCPFGPHRNDLQIRLFHEDARQLTSVTEKLIIDFGEWKINNVHSFDFSQESLSVIRVLPPQGGKSVFEGKIATEDQRRNLIIERRRQTLSQALRWLVITFAVCTIISIVFFSLQLFYHLPIYGYLDGFFARLSTAALFAALQTYIQSRLEPINLEHEAVVRWMPMAGRSSPPG